MFVIYDDDSNDHVEFLDELVELSVDIVPAQVRGGPASKAYRLASPFMIAKKLSLSYCSFFIGKVKLAIA